LAAVVDQHAVGPDQAEGVGLRQTGNQMDQVVVRGLFRGDRRQFARRSLLACELLIGHCPQNDVDRLDRARDLLGQSGRECLEISLRIVEPVVVQGPERQCGGG
jgi:hypothetical protein